MAAQVPDLTKLSAPALRKFARDHDIRITYILDRRKSDLIRLITEALEERKG